MASALDGITVLDLTDGPAGALTTMFLCDHGARVIRVVDSSDTTPTARRLSGLGQGQGVHPVGPLADRTTSAA